MSNTFDNPDHTDRPLLLLKTLLCEVKIELGKMPTLDRLCHIFWLLGPFILLIERSPADIWLSLIVIFFLIRLFVSRDFFFLKVFWVRTSFLFLAVCLLSASFSELSKLATLETLAWFRFPVFAMAVTFWLGQRKALLYAMFISTALGMLVMTGILFAELIIEGAKDGRLVWPYGDAVTGNYLSKVGFPAFLVTVALAISAKPRTAAIMGVLSFTGICISVMTGERINFLIRACGGMLAALVYKPVLKRYLALILFEMLAVLFVFASMPDLQERFTNSFVKSIPLSSDSDYYRVMGAGIEMFKIEPLLGIGPATHRDLCPKLLVDTQHFRCDNHPHNFYIQFLAEIGILGFLSGVLMVGAMLYSTFAVRSKNKNNVIVSTVFIVPLALFFPIASTSDFFGQWNNIFLWSSVALALSASKTLDSNAKEGAA